MKSAARCERTAENRAGVAAEMRRVLAAAVQPMAEELEALNERQTLALYHLFQGRNVFLSGSAGTGKTFTTRLIVRFMVALKQTVALTATTGLAAANLEEADSGVAPRTLHSFAGIGLGEDDVGDLIKALAQPRTPWQKVARNRWRETNLLIVDEVSMLSPVFFTKLDKVARAVRQRPSEPFGGLTVLLVGDFHQLEPVMKGAERNEALAMSASYCFQTQSWRDAVDVEVMLDQVYRQQDEQFVKLLQEVREGSASARSVRRLQDRTKMMLRLDLDHLARTHFGFERSRLLVEAARDRFDRAAHGRLGVGTLTAAPPTSSSGGSSNGSRVQIAADGDYDDTKGGGGGGAAPAAKRPCRRRRRECTLESDDDDGDDDDGSSGSGGGSGGGGSGAQECDNRDDADCAADDAASTAAEQEEEEEEAATTAHHACGAHDDVNWMRFDTYARAVARSTPFDETEALIRLLPDDLIDSAHKVYVSEVMPTRLMAVNRKVEEENSRQLANLHEPVVTFASRITMNMSRQHSLYGKAEKEFEKHFARNVLAPQRLHLKRGAQVMLLANVRPPALVNGRRGIVIDFRTLDEHDMATGVVRPVACTSSLLLSTSAAAGEKRKRRGFGELTPKEIEAIDKMSLPVVRFDNGVEARVEPYAWERKQRFEKKQVKAQYLQLPLLLSYAISIHKSQGLTISSLEVDLDEVFASGQTYVALSRATDLNGLVLRNFEPAYVNGTRQPPNQSVIDYYNAIDANQASYYVL